MDNIFDSYTKPIPPLRRDVHILPVSQNGESFLYFYDQMGYATPDFAVPQSAQTIFSLIDGRNSVEDILKFSDEKISREKILGYIRFLDEHALLESPYFRERIEEVELAYESSGHHLNQTAGTSYPEEENELQTFLEEAFEEHKTAAPAKKARALYAPHIDLRVGLDSYVKAFSALRELRPKRVIILATSHYSGLFPEVYHERPFVLSPKDFHMPNGVVENDREAVKKILKRVQDDGVGGVQDDGVENKQEESNGEDQEKRKGEKQGVGINKDSIPEAALERFGLSLQDRAHRVEHSIELHLLFLNHIWDHEFKIVPILVGGLDELFYAENSFRREQVNRFSGLLNEEFAADEKTFFLISGDLSHVGKKFGDSRPASAMMEEIKAFDESFMEAGLAGNSDQLLSLMKEEYDPYRICGYPPLYTFLNIFPETHGQKLSYDIWDETERDSAVSFGSILYGD